MPAKGGATKYWLSVMSKCLLLPLFFSLQKSTKYPIPSWVPKPLHTTVCMHACYHMTTGWWGGRISSCMLSHVEADEANATTFFRCLLTSPSFALVHRCSYNRLLHYWLTVFSHQRQSLNSNCQKAFVWFHQIFFQISFGPNVYQENPACWNDLQKQFQCVEYTEKMYRHGEYENGKLFRYWGGLIWFSYIYFATNKL